MKSVVIIMFLVFKKEMTSIKQFSLSGESKVIMYEA